MGFATHRYLVALRRLRLLTSVLLLTVVSDQAMAATSYLVIVAGLGGEPKYQERFHQWSMQMKTAAEQSLNINPQQVFYLGETLPETPPETPEDMPPETPDDAPHEKDAMHAKSTKENVSQVFRELAGRLQPDDQLFVLLIGHGSFRSDQARFNLPGPDLTAKEFDGLLKPFTSQRIVFVNTSSASGSFVPILSGENRIIVAATKTGLERNETFFAKYFVEAYVGNGADVDKNERVSVKEAFDYATSKVDGFYKEENRLKTEHAVMDDNGDGVATEAPSAKEGDGQFAMTAYLAAASGLAMADPNADQIESASPELKSLLTERSALEKRVRELATQKDAMTEELYLDELERLLLEIAELTDRIDQMKTNESK